MAFWNEIPLVGGLLGGIFGNPEQEAHEKALKRAQQEMFQYRPEALDARMNAMHSMAGAFGPANNMMGQMYGSGAQMDVGSMIQNPFSPEAQARMRAMANPKKNTTIRAQTPEWDPYSANNSVNHDYTKTG